MLSNDELVECVSNFRKEKQLKFRRDFFCDFPSITFFGEKKQKVNAHISSTNKLPVAKFMPRVIGRQNSCVMCL